MLLDSRGYAPNVCVNDPTRNGGVWGTPIGQDAMIEERFTQKARWKIVLRLAHNQVFRLLRYLDQCGYNARKFFSSCLPLSVRTDSGWNWTPSTFHLRWRTPMMTPSRVSALIWSSPGKDLRSTISEW
jgi:hypothetical protein